MQDDLIPFYDITPDGSIVSQTTISRLEVGRCPFFILVPEHYDKLGRCRCQDPDHTEMSDWGYVWRDGRWRAD